MGAMLSTVEIATKLGCADNTILRRPRRAVGFSSGFRRAFVGSRRSREPSRIVAAAGSRRFGFCATPKPNPYGSWAGCTIRRTFRASHESATRP